MQTAHGQTWECRSPAHDPIVFDQEIQYQEHSIKEHGVPEVHVGTLSNVARRPVLEKVLECPFGDDFQPLGKIESSAVFSSEALQSHVAGHMKEIALLILQKLPSDGDENEDAENVDSDQPLEDGAPADAYGITRASMYSVLDDEDLEFPEDDSEAANRHVEEHGEDISARVTVLDLADKDDSGMTKLHYAVQGNDCDLIRFSIKSGASANSKDKNGQTPLHLAVKRGFIECIEVLVKHGADLHISDNFGFSSFLWAVAIGQENAAMVLLSMDDSVNELTADGMSPLRWAANLGLYSTAKMLLEHKNTVPATEILQNPLPLGEAVASGNLRIAQLLAEYGWDWNHRDRDGWSTIHLAAEEGHLDIVRLLLDWGADPNAVSSYGTSALHCAANGGHVSIVSMLLERGTDPLRSTCHGWTALHHAAFMGHSEVMQCLLGDARLQSVASQQDNHGWSALHLAVHSRDVATVRVLLDQSVIADPQALLDESGLTAEEWLDRGSENPIQRAFANLAFSKSRCCRAVTGLRRVASTGSVPLARIVCTWTLGRDINDMNSGRRTALYHAAKNHMLPMTNLLLDLGADPNILPTGRKAWEEFVDDDHILLRLKRAGYQKRDIDPEIEDQIRHALRTRSLPSVGGQSACIVSDDSTLETLDQPVSHDPNRLSSLVPASSATPSNHAALSVRSRSPAPPHQMTNNKRKARSGLTEWWKRLKDGK